MHTINFGPPARDKHQPPPHHHPLTLIIKRPTFFVFYIKLIQIIWWVSKFSLFIADIN